MRTLTVVIVLFATAVVSWCLVNCSASRLPEKAAANTDGENFKELRKLAVADPVKDFEAAKKAGDLRFIGMMGYAMVVPGVPDYETRYSKRVGVKVVKGTTDAITSREQDRLQEAVRAYAEKYNELVINNLLQSKKTRHP